MPPRVKTAVNAGEENDAKSVATATTIETSQTARRGGRHDELALGTRGGAQHGHGQKERE